MKDHDIVEALRLFDIAGISYVVVDRCSDAACVVCTCHPLADVA